jgi:hypothetical protein
MIVRRLVASRSAKAVSRERKPSKNRVGRFIVFTLGSGALAALLAIVIAGIPTVLGVVFPAGSPEIQASALFPPVQPVHKVVDVYDPPKQAPRPNPAPVAPKPEPVEASPTAEPSEPPDGN